MGWRRQWHPTPVLLPGKSHGRRSLEGCSPWGHWESDTTERLHFHFSLSCIGEGNGNPLQCSCLENPRDGGVCWAAIYGVAQNRIQLKWLSSRLKSSIVPDMWRLTNELNWKMQGNNTKDLQILASQIQGPAEGRTCFLQCRQTGNTPASLPVASLSQWIRQTEFSKGTAWLIRLDYVLNWITWKLIPPLARE